MTINYLTKENETNLALEEFENNQANIQSVQKWLAEIAKAITDE